MLYLSSPLSEFALALCLRVRIRVYKTRMRTRLKSQTEVNSKEESFCFVFVSLRKKFSYIGYTHVASENITLSKSPTTLSHLSEGETRIENRSKNSKCKQSLFALVVRIGVFSFSRM